MQQLDQKSEGHSGVPLVCIMVRSTVVVDKMGLPRNCKDLIEDLEIENALDLVQRFREFVHRSVYPQCIKRILAHIVNGDFIQFKNSIDSGCLLAQQRIVTNGLPSEVKSSLPLTPDSIRRRIYENVLKAGYDSSREVTLFMYLSVSHGKDLKCQNVNHGYCRIMLDIIKNASPGVVREQLMMRTKIDRSALHYAATTGQACQLATLLQGGIYMDLTDKSGRSALHYAIERSSRLLVLCLLLGGADMSKSQKSRPCYAPRLLSASHSNTLELGQYLNGRMEYVQEMFMHWANKFCENFCSIDQRYSEIHCMRLSRDSDNLSTTSCIPEDLQRSVCVDINEGIFGLSKDNDTSLSVLMFPVFYRLRRDSDDDSYKLELCRTDFFSSCRKAENVIAGRVLLKGAYMELFLESEITPEHNGYFYMYHLPKTVVPGPHELFFNLDLKRMSSEQLQSCFFIVGVVSIKRKRPIKIEHHPQRNNPEMKQKSD
ncbi:hypothetical protein QR680_005526 [Steinernema hermaphroditum]|uniref:ANK_REP_REGION domain-containing protein n=1 Tax=Steinernema hermaphroditum TaxID=289476 RepID=A0AA39HSC0_9BILA|nr:hypothetical protein QR680_005526 [Steinernema hermaphroditum]